MLRCALVCLVTLLVGCSSSSSGGDAAQPVADAGTTATPPDAVGPHPVGHTTFVLVDAARNRSLRVEAWYPADESARVAATAGTALEDLEPPGPSHDVLASLVAAAPNGCTRKHLSSAADAPPIAGSLPLLAFSHCLGCARFDAAFVAERLASHGFAVIAPDHTGDTLWDVAMGQNVMLGSDFLQVRVADIRAVLDAALDPASTAIPASLRGHFDASRVGMLGHSFGALTTGLTLQLDNRPRAGLALAAPMDAFPPTMIATIKQPIMFLLAAEDHSIGEAGNGSIRYNFMQATAPARLVEVANAGHWSFTDICALTSAFVPGCGMSTSQQKGHLGDAFTYIDNDAARSLAASYAVAFFTSELLGDGAAKTWLDTPHPADGTVTVTAK
jgi:predicted dienelactone hydrolase